VEQADALSLSHPLETLTILRDIPDMTQTSEKMTFGADVSRLLDLAHALIPTAMFSAS
jgi:hypothetical protein